MDHVLFVLVAVVSPISGWIRFERVSRAIRSGTTSRCALYRSVMRSEWIGIAIVLVTWFVLSRRLDSLLSLPAGTGWIAVGWLLTILIWALLEWQVKLVASSDERRAEARKGIGDLDFMVARTREERALYSKLSVTVGICEEVIYRGFVIVYLMAATGLPVWAAALISAAIFGVVHIYQGASGVFRTAVVGLMLAGLYVLTGSLLAPMIVHVVLDLTSGRIGRLALA